MRRYCQHSERIEGETIAVAVQLDFRGTTLAQYDHVIEKMGLTPEGPVPKGALFHWVAKTEDGIRVVDVWESAQQFNKFADEQIGPFTKEVGISEPPQITFFDVHNYLRSR